MTEERYLFLGGHRKCGTTMLLNLFDGHDACCVFPTDISVLYGYFPVFCENDYSEKERLERLDIVIFRTLERLCERQGLEGTLPIDLMRQHFFDSIIKDKLDQIDVVIRQIIASFRHAFDLSVEKAPLVVIKETSLEIYASFLYSRFPGAQFIQLLRDPRDNYGALRAGLDKHYCHFGEGQRHILASLLHRVSIGMELIAPNIERFGAEHFKTVEFAKLTANPQTVIQNVCEFAGITFSDKMVVPTVLNKPTAGNNYDQQKFFEISSKNVGRWSERISDQEAQVIEFHLGTLMQQYGYELAFSRTESADAASEFYMWSNYCYFFKDSFAVL